MANVSSYKTGSLSNKFVLIRLFLVCLLLQSTYPCGPGRGYGIRNRPKKMTPLVFKQHVPNVSENTLGASGLAEGAISRKDPKYKELVQNNNPEIVFKDEEGTGADRMMTQRCKDKLNALSIMVMNHWPGVKLRVTEGWDEDEHHSSDSLHYEGRAVDVTTSDRDRAKYGMLARLAVEAGFDWVYFESRGHIHCSVKSDSSIAVKTGGCFPGASTVNLEGGQTMTMDRLSIGDRVQALDHKGALVFSEIIAFLHRTPDELMLFLELELDEGAKITLTEDHMIYATSSKTPGDVQLASLLGSPYFAGHVRLGDTLYRNNGTSFQKSRVNRISQAVHTGVYAPLTREGTIVVDSMAASCYASFASHSIAQASMTPLRLAYSFADVIWSRDKTATPSSGVHWYARLLFNYAKYFLSDGSWYR